MVAEGAKRRRLSKFAAPAAPEAKSSDSGFGEVRRRVLKQQVRAQTPPASRFFRNGAEPQPATPTESERARRQSGGQVNRKQFGPFIIGERKPSKRINPFGCALL